MKLAAIAQRIGGEVYGDSQCPINKIATLEHAETGDISFLANARYRDSLTKTKASAVILRSIDLPLCPTNAIVVEQPYLGYSQVAAILAPQQALHAGIHPTAIISPQANIAKSAWVGPYCVIDADVSIDSRVQLDALCVIKKNSRIGKQTQLRAGVTICQNTILGQRGLIHPGVVIGADGFGLANDAGIWRKIPQMGGVRIGDDVEIGANATIDCGALDDTIIGDGVKIDNQVQVAHNVIIGNHTAIAGCVGIAGSATIGQRCSIGGGVGILGHVVIVDDVVVTGMTFVSKSITKPGIYSSGTPLETNHHWKRNMVRMKQLDGLTKRVSELEKQLNIKKG